MGRLAFGLALLPTLLAGCGHPATEAECQEILVLSAAIVLRSESITDEQAVRERTASFRDLRGAELLKSCVGKRITDRAMRCMRVAATAEQFDACLD